MVRNDVSAVVFFINRRVIRNDPHLVKRVYRLARPGFPYSEEYKEFVLPKLFNINTGNLISSLQTFKKERIEK